MSKLWVLAVVLLIAGCGASKRYELVATRGKSTYLVYVPQQYAADQSAYEQAIREICSDPQGTYILMFWNDRTKVWHKDNDEMTGEQSAAQVAGYVRNPATGLNDFYWIRDHKRIGVGPIQ